MWKSIKFVENQVSYPRWYIHLWWRFFASLALIVWIIRIQWEWWEVRMVVKLVFVFSPREGEEEVWECQQQLRKFPTKTCCSRRKCWSMPAGSWKVFTSKTPHLKFCDDNQLTWRRKSCFSFQMRIQWDSMASEKERCSAVSESFLLLLVYAALLPLSTSVWWCLPFSSATLTSDDLHKNAAVCKFLQADSTRRWCPRVPCVGGV